MTPLRLSALAFVVAVFAASASIAPLAAQAADRGPVVANLGFGARAQGTGGGFQPGEGDPDAVFVNPALAAMAGGFALGWQRFDTESTALSLSTARAWYGGGVFGGIRVLDHGGAEGPGTHPGGLDPLLAGTGPGATDMALTVGYGRSLLGFRTGVAAHWLLQRSGPTNAATVGVDLGLARRVGPGWLHGAVRNLGPSSTWGEREVDLPTEVGIGWGAWGRPLGPLDVGAAVDVTRRADGEWIAGGGLEFGYWPVRGRTFVARVGARSVPEGEASPLTLGGSFWGDDLVIDYAFQAVDGFDGVHRVTLGWR